MRRHDLKTWPDAFGAILNGSKTFELRKNDRDFSVGDRLLLREWDPSPGPARVPLGYTGRGYSARVTYVLHGGRFGLPPELCVMSIVRDATGEAPVDY